LTGHSQRADDLARLASLGATAIRYPVLWGRTSDGAATAWSWADDRLTSLSALGVRPIVGLLHHGFGPIGLDPRVPDYPDRFGSYAQAVAQRYPWVDAYVPVNEPLTTARFGALYGWWPPYATDHGTFARVLVAQCRAYRNAARAIRRVRSDARITITEDAGRSFGTSQLSERLAHDNARRWLTFDLVTGAVDRNHALWQYLVDAAPDVRGHLEELADDPEPPDILGLNRYVTSDRFLDHRLDLYPVQLHGGGGGTAYVDVELIRVDGPASPGFFGAIREAWHRYHRPLALTEVQLAGDPRDQVAWWAEAWRDAVRAGAEGIPIVGVTAWAALGAWEWASVLRRRDGSYEAGCFDCRDGVARTRPLAEAVRRTALTGDPGPAERGWWTTPDRIMYPALPDDAGRSEHAA
jgi:dTDP-4-dehydrorhamnose reductase